MKKAYPYILSGLFLILLIIPGLFSFVSRPGNESTESENRKITELPEIDLNQLDKFPPSFNAYYDDNFSFRPMGVKFYNRFNYFFLKKSPDETQAVLGRDNWIFLGKDMDYYRGLVHMNQVEKLALKKEFEDRNEFLKEQDCKFLIVIVPTKKEIYPEYLPLEYFKYSETTMTDQFIDVIHQIPGIGLIDLRPVLRSAKTKYPELYHRYDHHWNDYGAFPAYQGIIKYANQFWKTPDARRIDEFTEEKYETMGGSLAKMLGVEDEISFYRYRLNPEFTYDIEKLPNKYEPPKGFAYKSAFENNFKSQDDSLPRLMMICDSFGEYLFKNLSGHFSQSIFIFDAWQYKLNQDIVDKEKPDLYVLCIYESFIPNIMKYQGQ